MKTRLAKGIFGCLALALSSAAAQDYRVWTDANGRTVEGAVVASDLNWFTIVNEEGKKGAIQIKQLGDDDQAWLKKWREENRDAPWIDPERPPPWPQTLGAGLAEVEKVEQSPESRVFVYRSANFELQSDVKLPDRFSREVASIFEATRTAVKTLPLGLAADPNHGRRRQPSLRSRSDRLVVQLFDAPNDYARAGGPTGTSGTYISWLGRTLISLENVGERDEQGELDLDVLKNEYLLRHEITHQVMHDWLRHLPMWLREGFAEYLGAVGYEDGKYTFDELNLRMQAYVNKWRFDEDPNRIPMLHPAKIMAMSEQEWQQSLKRETPILNYNSAALLTYFFLHQSSEKAGAHLAEYLDAIRRGAPGHEAAKTHLMRGRTADELAAELVARWKGFNVKIEISDDL
ncbi:MAG: hypothetical protein ACI8UO_002857 [Verrucomicrobiales bacterium]|jgi:hypothetical protein